MLEDQVAYLLQRYLGNYVLGLNKEALKISVWQGVLVQRQDFSTTQLTRLLDRPGRALNFPTLVAEYRIHVSINVSSPVYRDFGGNFALPVGYDLVWRSCPGDFVAPVSIWLPRPPNGFIAAGCVAVAAYEEPPLDSAYCLSASMAEEAQFEEQIVWSAPESYPWACYVYQVQSEALQFIALRQPKEESEWRPTRVSSRLPQQEVSESSEGAKMRAEGTS